MATGQDIGPYRILRQIKRGGQGSVLLGYDPRLHRRVAIKTYPLPGDRRGRREALKEARLIAALDSPRIVRIYDVIVADRHLAMVMEYVPGCDMEELLSRQALSLASAVAVGQDIAGAIAVARQNGLVHGDIKAANILVGTDGRAKLTDFGISRRAFQSGQGAGSPLSVAPEQISGDVLDVRTDLFALGCLLYRMLTGRHAYPGLRFPAPSSDITAPAYPDGPPTLDAATSAGEAVPEALAELVTALLQLRPADRPQNTHSVRRMLRAVSKSLPIALERDLRHAAKPWFREESAEDLPPEIPADFQRGWQGSTGQSLLAGGRWRHWKRWWPAAATGVLLLGIAAGLHWLSRPQLVVLAPRIAVEPGLPLPNELTRDWLVEQLVTAAGHHAAGVGTSLRTAPADQSSDETPATAANSLQLELRCREQLCVLGLALIGDRELARAQEPLFPDAPLTAWRQALDAMTARVMSGR